MNMLQRMNANTISNWHVVTWSECWTQNYSWSIWTEDDWSSMDYAIVSRFSRGDENDMEDLGSKRIQVPRNYILYVERGIALLRMAKQRLLNYQRFSL